MLYAPDPATVQLSHLRAGARYRMKTFDPVTGERVGSSRGHWLSERVRGLAEATSGVLPRLHLSVFINTSRSCVAYLSPSLFRPYAHLLSLSFNRVLN